MAVVMLPGFVSKLLNWKVSKGKLAPISVVLRLYELRAPLDTKLDWVHSCIIRENILEFNKREILKL